MLEAPLPAVSRTELSQSSPFDFPVIMGNFDLLTTSAEKLSVLESGPSPALAGARDYFALMKPRVMSLVVFTALVGLAVAPAAMHPITAFTALLCIAVGAGAAGALNMGYDADIDACMIRTSRRPVPMGRLRAGDALAFGITLAGFSVATLGVLVNWLAATLLAFTIFFYVVIYTVWLKRATPHNIVIGGAAGAFPPMIGWAAATGSLSLEPLILFLIIFFWTPPHFWALALYRTEDYARAGVPMLPVVAGDKATRRQILLYTAILVPVGLSPWLFGYSGLLYGTTALITGAIMLLLALQVYRERYPADRASRQMFAFSILYLFLLFAALLVDTGWGGLMREMA